MPTVLGYRDSSGSASDGLQKDDQHWVYKASRKRTIVVLADSASQTEDDIANTTGVPALFSPVNGCYCKSREFREVQTVIHPTTGVLTILWEVDCDFDSDMDPNQNQPPESQRPTLSWDAEEEDEVLKFDLGNGQPIKTDADEPMFIEVPEYYPTLSITRYERGVFDPRVILMYVNHTNSVPFYGAPTNTTVCTGIRADEEQKKTSNDPNAATELYNKVTYNFKFKIKRATAAAWGMVLVTDNMLEGTMLHRQLHAGYKYRKVAGGPPLVYLDKQGNPQMVNLKLEDGTKLAEGAPAEYKVFTTKFEADFNNLNLGPF